MNNNATQGEYAMCRSTASVRTRTRLRLPGLLLLAALGSPAMAEFQELVTFPAGLACEFALKIEADGSGVRVNREPARGRWQSISAGTGADLRLTNVSTAAAITLQGNGAVVMNQRAGDNGSTITQMTGHNILFLFPTDTPAGPSSTLYVGQVSFATDANANATLLSSSGRSLDLCAALSQ